MYRKHPAFLEPDSADAMIWRYMDVPKFLSMIHSNTLYFARGDRFEDPYEGMLTEFIANNIRSSGEEHLRMWHQHHLNSRYDTYINCWHWSDHESAAMWKLYGTGIAIQCSFASLVDSLSEGTEPVHIGLVRYGDEHLRGDTMPNGLSFWLTKRKSFEYERELRAVIWRPRNTGVGMMVTNGGNDGWTVAGYPTATADTPLGIGYAVKLDVLIKRIVLSPDMPNWIKTPLEDIIRKFGFAFPIDKSRLYELSLFET